MKNHEEMPKGEQRPSVEELKEKGKKLIEEVEAAKVQQQKDIKEKADNIEILIKQRKQDEELLEETRKTIDYFELQENMELLDEDGKKELEKLRETARSLQQHAQTLDQKIQDLTSRPEVMGEIQDRAIKENAEKEEKLILEKGHSEYDPKVKEFAKTINEFAKEKIELSEKEEKTSKDYKEQIEDFESLMKKIPEKHRTEIQKIHDEYKNWKDFIAALALNEDKARFGKKKAFKQILSEESLLSVLVVLQNEYDILQDREREMKGQGKELPDQFLQLLKEVEEKVQVKLYDIGSNKDFVSSLHSDLTRSIEGFAVERWAQKHARSPSTVKKGDYNGWYELNHIPENRIIYDIYEKISEQASRFIHGKERMDMIYKK